MGIGSFLEDIDNKIEIIQLDDELESFEVRGSFTHKYPPTKLMWIPDLEGVYEACSWDYIERFVKIHKAIVNPLCPMLGLLNDASEC